MAIEKFRFLSPGIQVNEIDDSILPTPFPATGPVVIGNTSRGPIMQPVQVSSVSELERVFGTTSNGKVGATDVWRTGVSTSPTLATYAARAYLQNASPITVMRLGGVAYQSGLHDSGTMPGWKANTVYQIFGVSGSEASLIANIYSDTGVSFTLASGSSGSYTGGHFDIIMSSSVNGSVTKNVSLQFSSASFIRNQLNTNPTKYTDGSTKYFLGETFENSTGSINGFNKVFIKSDTNKASFYTSGTVAAETGWVIDDLASGSYNELFKFVGLDNGSTLHKDIKISIENVRESKNKNITKFGSFDVVVRKLFETETQSVIERFSDVNLDINSENYIARKIGDTYRFWNSVSKRYEEEGTYANRSAFVRVVMAENDIPATALPHGFVLPYMPKQDVTSIDSAVTTASRPNVSMFKDAVTFTQAKSKRFGLVADAIKNADVVDITSFAGAQVLDSGSSPFVFHTRHINVTGSSKLVYASGSTVNTIDVLVNATSPSGSILGFDMPIYGGSDGRNILEVESFVSDRLLDGKNENNSAAYRAIKQALDTVADADLMDMNLLCVPGLKEQTLTDYMLEMCKLRGDTLAIIDLDGDHKYYYEVNNAQVDVRPTSVNDVVTNLQNRQVDNSYGAAYFPAVFVPSEGIYMPASIAALGAIGGTEGRAGLWFAPAGFNRGGLNVGSAGIGVSRTALQLNSSDRDILYSSNINPIATFPNEGVVIFGQKTLQTTPSALDRVNVRRLLNYLKKEISRAATRVIFEPNIEATWNSFKSVVEPFLLSVKNAYGLDDARVLLDSSTTTADLIDRNIMYCKIYIKPTKAIEYIAIDFVVSNSGAAFPATS